MKSLILTNIISSNSVYKLNSYIQKHKKTLGEVLVLFCGQTESNREWKLNEKPEFKYEVLKGKKFEIRSKDLFTFFYTPQIFKYLTQYNPGRIIIGGWDQPAYIISFLWGWLKGRRITLWSGSTRNEKSWRRIVSYPLVWFLVNISTDYIAYGTRAKKYLVSLGAKPNKIEVFINDVNKKYFSKEAIKYRKKRSKIKRELGIKTKYNFIYVGQFIQRKGILNLIEAFGHFSNADRNWGLVLVGYGKLKSEIESYLKQNLIKNVYLLGLIEQYNLPKIYASCDVLVLPSDEEVWGLVVNEALHSGLKVLVSDKCGCGPDLVKEGINGYTFKVNGENKLFTGMENIAKIVARIKDRNPFFSIITSTYNSSKFLPTNIKSVRNQTFKDYEHLFVDAYSKDKTLSIIERYKKQNPKTVRLYQKTPKGISNAMNEGIKLAKGKYLIFLHSDDSLYNKNVLRSVHTYLIKNPQLDWIYGKINVVEKNGKSIGKYPGRKIYRYFPRYFLKYYNTIPHQAVFMKNAVFEKYGDFDESLSSIMDIEYWLRISGKTNWGFFNRVISNFMIRKGAQTSDISRKPENDKNTFEVRNRYLNHLEMFIFRILKFIIDRYNKTYR